MVNSLQGASSCNWPHLRLEIEADSRFEVAVAVPGRRSRDGGAHFI